MSINYITPVEESGVSNKRPSVFDRLTDPISNNSVFGRLVELTPKASVFERLGPLKKKYKCQGNYRRMVEHVHTQEHDSTKNYPSLIPSRLRRETKLIVSCGEVLSVKTHTIVHTRERDEEEESVGSSHYITIYDKKGTPPHSKVDDGFVDVRTCHHISFDDGDP